jgi:hypothetical protein
LAVLIYYFKNPQPTHYYSVFKDQILPAATFAFAVAAEEAL